MSLVLLFLLGVATSSAHGVEYFVAPHGHDSNPGDAAQPLHSIAQGVARLEAGDTLVVAPGTYAESVVIARAGAAGAPITIRGLPGAVLVNPVPGSSRSAFDVWAGAAHVAVRGFEITGGFAESVFVRDGTHAIELANLDIHHNHAGIWIGGATAVVVRDTAVHHNARSGIRIFAGARDVRIIDVRAEHQDDGRGCAGDADGLSVDASVSDLVLTRVQANYNSEDGIDVGARDVQLREVTAVGNACSGLKIGGGGRIHNALIGGSRIGVNVSGGADTATALINATLLDNGIGVRALGVGYQVALQNCIVSGNGKALHVNSDVALTEHHNIFYRPDADSRLIVRTVIGGELLYSGADVNSGRWQTASGGQGQGTIAVDPQLDASGRPVSPRGPAIDSGDASGVPPIDLDGRVRPTGGGVDRGAFEFQPTVASAAVTRVVVRNDGGNGEVRLRMNLELPPGSPFDIGAETVLLTVRGTAGTMMNAEIDDAGRFGSSRRRVRFRRAGRERISVTIRQRGGVIRVSLRAAGVNVAALQSNELWVDLVAGALLANAHAPLRNSGGRLSLP